MNAILEEAMVAARLSPSLYAAPFVGALRGAVREVRRVRREMNRQKRLLHARHAHLSKGPPTYGHRIWERPIGLASVIESSQRTTMAKGVIALDADGVLLDYGLAYAGAWRKAFGMGPRERDPQAYWPIDRWDVDVLEGDRLERFRCAFDEDFWSSIPPVSGAVNACQQLAAAGFELVCVTALPQEFRGARERNLRTLGFPIDVVHATPRAEGACSPKAATLNALRPAAFVDDFLPYFSGVDPSIHRALILRAANGSPNAGELLAHIDSKHPDLRTFAQHWLGGKCHNPGR